jgi:hypothetical protein
MRDRRDIRPRPAIVDHANDVRIYQNTRKQLSMVHFRTKHSKAEGWIENLWYPNTPWRVAKPDPVVEAMSLGRSTEKDPAELRHGGSKLL